MKVRWLCVEPSNGSCRKTSTQYFDGMPSPGVAAFCCAFSMACVRSSVSSAPREGQGEEGRRRVSRKILKHFHAVFATYAADVAQRTSSKVMGGRVVAVLNISGEFKE